MFYIKIYLDDNKERNLLLGILRSNGFEVISPREIGMMGKGDDDHIKCAAYKGAIVLTEDQEFPVPNPKIQHKGILIIYRNENPKKDFTYAKIVKALKNIQKQTEEENLNLENQTLPLNLFVY